MAVVADRFWNYDYIAMPAGRMCRANFAGNGGFSLRSKAARSRRAMTPSRSVRNNEDEAICIRHRALLESKYGIAFADERCYYCGYY